MPNGDWITEPGTVGEVPVKIHPDNEAEFVLDFAEGVRIDSYDLLTDVDLSPADICILTVRIENVDSDHDPTRIGVTVGDVEVVRKASDKRRVITEMMQRLDDARERRDDSKTGCENCLSITSQTTLMVSDKRSGRDLHYCSNCGRMLTAEEYQEWKRKSGPM